MFAFTGTAVITCPQGYKRYRDSCYKFVSNSKKTFDKARDACKSEGADLIRVDSPFKQGKLLLFVTLIALISRIALVLISNTFYRSYIAIIILCVT